jgi:hypothetical protein
MAEETDMGQRRIGLCERVRRQRNCRKFQLWLSDLKQQLITGLVSHNRFNELGIPVSHIAHSFADRERLKILSRAAAVSWDLDCSFLRQIWIKLFPCMLKR